MDQYYGINPQCWQAGDEYFAHTSYPLGPVGDHTYKRLINNMEWECGKRVVLPFLEFLTCHLSLRLPATAGRGGSVLVGQTIFLLRRVAATVRPGIGRIDTMLESKNRRNRGVESIQTKNRSNSAQIYRKQNLRDKRVTL